MFEADKSLLSEAQRLYDKQPNEFRETISFVIENKIELDLQELIDHVSSKVWKLRKTTHV